METERVVLSLHLSDVHDAKPAGCCLLPLIHGLDNVGEMTVLLPDGRVGLVERPVRRCFLRDGEKAVSSSWGYWGVLQPTLVIFVLRRRHNNQPLL